MTGVGLGGGLGALATAAGLQTSTFAGGLLMLTGAWTTAWVTASMTRCVGASQCGPRERPLVDWRDFVACASLTIADCASNLDYC
jgi:hypothetical protein